MSQPESRAQSSSSSLDTAEEMRQLDLFQHVLAAYAAAPSGRLTNADLYSAVARSAGISDDELAVRAPVGRSGKRHGILTRKIRWHQQTLKHLGVLRHPPGRSGMWELAEESPDALGKALHGTRLVAFSTRLGVAIWSDCKGLARLNEDVTLLLTSPPYPLRRPRAYGNPTVEEYNDFICAAIEPIVRHLVPGGSICLNLGADIFVQGSPARSMYREHLAIALATRFSLHKMDDIVWMNPARPPGPIQWASKSRVQLNATYEAILWMTNDPTRVRADNRRVLQPHTPRHLKFVEGGGERKEKSYADGAHHTRAGAYSARTEGRIPRNVLVHAHTCADTRRYRRDATALGLPIHGAMQPLSIPTFLIRFLTEPGDLVVDPFSGTAKTGRAAESEGRRWLVTEIMLAYLRGSAERFRDAEGFRCEPWFDRWPREGLGHCANSP